MIRTGGEVTRLIEELRRTDAARREAAIARLRVAGTRATDALTVLAQGQESLETRAAALKALKGIDDPRVVDATLPLLSETESVLIAAAIGVLRQWLTREPGTRVLDTLTSIALDSARDPAIRLSALDAIGELPRHLVAPVLAQASLGPPASLGVDDPQSFQEWLTGNSHAPLSDVHALIVRVRDHERQERAADRRELWTRVRGTAHAQLAARGSTVALYDLRETFDAAKMPLPLDYLTAVTTIGDASCLEPMARAWAAAPAENWWRERLADAAADIMRRSGLSGRNSLVKRIRAKWPSFV